MICVRLVQPAKAKLSPRLGKRRGPAQFAPADSRVRYHCDQLRAVAARFGGAAEIKRKATYLSLEEDSDVELDVQNTQTVGSSVEYDKLQKRFTWKKCRAYDLA